MKKTNLDEIRLLTKSLFMAVPLNEEMCGIAVHPFISTVFDYDGKELVDLRDAENFRKCRDRYFKAIDGGDLTRIYMLVRTAWKLTWFKFVKDHLSVEDYAKYLEDCWVSEENPNMDVNVSIRESIGYFKKAKKEYLMTPEDYEYYTNIPNKIKVWRGVAEGRVKLGLSWTDDKSKAEWFMNRFGSKGYLLEVVVDKKDILAYFNSRNEKEVVVDVLRVKNKIKKVS